MGDIRERTAMHQARLALESLNQVWLDCVFEQDGHRACGPEVLGGHRTLSVVAVTNRNPAKPPAQVLEIAGDRGDGHHFRCGRDVEPGLARIPVGPSAQADGDLPQRAVIDVDRTPPRDAERVQVMTVAVQDGGIEHGRQQVVGRSNRVDVAREVQIQVLHRHHLRIAAAGRAPLDPEDRPQRRFPQTEHRLAADRPEPLRERDRRGRLSFARARGRHPGDADELALRDTSDTLQRRQVDLRFVAAVRLDLVRLEPDLFGDCLDRLELRFLSDLQTGNWWLNCGAHRGPSARQIATLYGRILISGLLPPRPARRRAGPRRNARARTGRSVRASWRSRRVRRASCPQSGLP